MQVVAGLRGRYGAEVDVGKTRARERLVHGVDEIEWLTNRTLQ
jgi:hypothetical protein